MSREAILEDRLETSLITIESLAKILINNEALRGSDQPPQLDSLDVDAVMRAVLLISGRAHDDFCEVMNSMEARQ
ncbi:hypothetical protein H7A76_06415 [Pseudomonas sp. MSSRFD41]|uniref:hypothetical protein n=1 Tax=Pseudomonas sp. MSSRFD41 TaxID=1310370 RepID=UPI00163A0504|nr:hypothetical protein [Pseudomonas sp. MSSRFD41]MBC2655069.1 hypothetical protein [Pseudomonas sp. MSSRFD41]